MITFEEHALEYTKKAASGDAGEFFTAYKIVKTLGWPCRLFDIDIGIDAQVEILSEDRQSTGQFVALQVKAREYKANCVHISEDHLDYWNTLNIPVFMVLVDHTKAKIFLHLVGNKSKYKKTNKGLFIIPFDRKKEVFDKKKSGKIMAEAHALLRARDIKDKFLMPIQNLLDNLDSAANPGDDVGFSIDVVEEALAGRTQIVLALEQARAACTSQRISCDFVDDIAKSFESDLKKLESPARSISGDGYRNTVVEAFLDERR